MDFVRRLARSNVNSTAKFMVLGLLAVAGVAGPQAARAQSIFDSTGGTSPSPLNYDLLDFTVSGCTLTGSGGAPTGACNAANVQVTGNGTTNGANIIFEGTGTPTAKGSNVFSLTTGQSEELKFNLAVTNAGSRHLITKITNTLNGYLSSDLDGDINGTLYSNVTYGTHNIDANLNIPGTANGTSSASANATFAGVSTLNLSVDLLLHVTGTLDTDDTPALLKNVVLTFFPAPEPASIAVFGTAVGGMILARRRKKAEGSAKAAKH